ncbi:MAG: flagellar basal body-associated FliL family protein [Sphingobium sp.]
MSDEAEAAPNKKGGKGKMILILLIVLVVCGAGAAGGLYAAGAFGHAAEGPKEDPNKPRLVLADEDPEAVAAKYSGTPAKDDSEPAAHTEAGVGFKLPKGGVDLPRPANVAAYHATYYQIPIPFTSNLIDTDSFAQISIAVSTYYDARVTAALKTHEMALRSAILLLLAQEAETVIATPQGKQQLQAKLTKLINKILKENTGYGGIDNVYFTNFVIQ